MTASDQPARAGHRGPAVLGFIVFIIAAAFALAADVPRTGYGIKSDEATYVAAALSAAFDRDLSFERRDLERFSGLYHSGPDGIFLKRGKLLRIRLHASPPFVEIAKRADPDANRLFFGKALIYPLIAAPFVRFWGLNGFLLLHVILLGAAATAAYLFLAAQSTSVAAAAFVTAFIGATILPVHSVFLMPEAFNFSLVMLAYFFWLFKEVSPRAALAGRWSDIAAAVLLGVCTYSKPLPTAILVAPLVLLQFIRKRPAWGITIGAVSVVVAASLFAWNAAVTGEFNYQGGDRKTFYGSFPFDAPDATWEHRGGSVATGAATELEALGGPSFPIKFGHNLEYFLVGRYFGFLPYFFPGLVAVFAWLVSRERGTTWRLMCFAGFATSALALLVLLPWTWSGGGGPPGNRYISNAYPVLLFLVPPMRRAWTGVLAWIGGAMFTAKVLLNPFGAAKFTYLITEKGPARRLPVELTMANDLPVMLAQPLRGRVHYQYGPDAVFLYFLDQNAWPPEPVEKNPDGSMVYAMWVSGAGRADIIVRAAFPIQRLAFEADSPIHTVLTITAGREPMTMTLEPHKPVAFDVWASGVQGFHDYDYLMTIRSSDGFVPHLLDAQSADYRNLGAKLRFSALKPVAP